MTVWKTEAMPDGEDRWFLVRVGNYVPVVVYREYDQFYDVKYEIINFVSGPMTWTEIPE